MGIRRLLLSALAGAAIMLLLAAVWHIALMGRYYAAGVSQVQEVVRYDVIALAYLVLGALMAIIYPKGYAGGSPASEGFRFGVLIGLVYAMPHAMVAVAATGSASGSLVLVDAAWHMVEQGVGGAVIALVYGRLGGAPLQPADVDEDTVV